MHKDHVYTLIIAIFMLVVMSGFLIFIAHAPNKNTTTSLSIGTLVVYEEKTGESTQVVAYNAQIKKSRVLYESKAKNTETRLDNETLSIFNPDSKVITRINVFDNNTQTITCSECEDLPFFNQDQSQMAYALLPKKNSKYATIRIHDLKSNTVREAAFQPQDADAEKLTPVYWSNDGSRIYLKRSAPAEGYFPGIYELNVASLTVSPVTQLNDFIVNAVDPRGYAFGSNVDDLRQNKTDEYTAPSTKVIRTYNLERSATERTYPLTRSQSQLILQRSMSEQIAFINNQALWVTGESKDDERQIYSSNRLMTRGALYSSTIAIQEISDQEETLRVFDLSTPEASTVISSQDTKQGSLHLIGISQRLSQ